MTTYVVTGGAGFIGSNIVDRLVQEGHDVRVVDDFSTGHERNLARVADRTELLRGSVCDTELLRRACEGADCVLHQAALASVPRSIENPVATNEANVEGTLKVLKTADECGVRRVVYASSSSVYGDSPRLPKREEMTPRPKSPYAVSKLAGEHYCTVFDEVYDVEAVALRYFNVFGPRQDPTSQYAAVIPIFVKCILEGERPEVFGDGEQSRDFTFVEDVVEANLQAARAPEAAGRVCNLGCGRRFTLNELLELLAQITGREVDPEYGPERPGDVRHSEADISLARQSFGYDPQISFEEGLRRTVQWYREQMM
ncbi:MAG: SDR family oxidoreductase [Planctomycetota bacterium]